MYIIDVAPKRGRVMLTARNDANDAMNLILRTPTHGQRFAEC